MNIDFFRNEEFEPGKSKVQKIIYGSGAIGAVIITVGLIVYLTASVQLGGILFILGILTGIIPYGLLTFLKNRQVRALESQFPSFLNDLAESKRGGMTILDAFESATDTDYGRLNKEIDKVYKQLTWGIPFPDVMNRFSKRMEASPVIQESLSIIIQSFQSGGNITDTIESVSDNAANLRQVIQNKRSKLKQQLLIMYVIYFLFIGITVGIYVMLSQLMGLGTQESGALQGVSGVLGGGEGGGSSGPTNFCGEDILAAQPFCSSAKIFGFIPGNITDLSSSYAESYAYGKMAYFKSLLFLMLMVQGAATAAVSGQISEGSPAGGIKHALIMMPLAFVVFMFVIRPMGL